MRKKVKTTTIKMWIIAIYVLLILQIIMFVNIKEIAKQQEIMRYQITKLEGGSNHEQY